MSATLLTRTEPLLSTSLSGREGVAKSFEGDCKVLGCEEIGSSSDPPGQRNELRTGYKCLEQAFTLAWNLLTTFNCWQQLQSSTIRESPAKPSEPAITAIPHSPSVKQSCGLRQQGTS